VRGTAAALTLVCSLLLCSLAADAAVRPAIDLGWLQAIQQDNGWLVIRSYHFPSSQEPVLPGDLIVAVDKQQVDSCNAISAARILSRIQAGAGTAKVIRKGAVTTLHFLPQQEPLLKSFRQPRGSEKLPLYGKLALAPIVALPDVLGQTHTLRYGPKWTLVHIWSTGCPPCWRDVSALNEISIQPEPSLAVIGIAINDNVETIKAFSQREPLGFVNLLGGDWNDGQIAHTFGPTEVPTDVLVDPSGHVVFVAVGSDALRSTLEALKEFSPR